MTQFAQATGHVLHRLANSVDRRRREAQHRRGIKRLEALPSDLLCDIGLTREDLHEARTMPRDRDALRILADRRRARRF